MVSKQFTNKKSIEEADFQYILNSIEVITPFGKEYLKSLKPFLPSQEKNLKEELDIVEKTINFCIKEKSELEAIKKTIMPSKDIRFSIEKAGTETLSVVELYEVKSLLLVFEELEKILKLKTLPEIFDLESSREILDVVDPRKDRISTFYIYEEFSQRLQELRIAKKEKELVIRKEKKKIREQIKEEYNINLTPKFEYIISKNEKEILEKLNFIESLVQKSQDMTTITFEIIENDNQKQIKEHIENLEIEIEKEELEVRKTLSRKIFQSKDIINKNLLQIGKLDFTIAKAEYAIKNNCSKPEIVKEHVIEIVDGVHLKAKEILNKKKKEYKPISISLTNGVTCITGANMGGKTLSLKLIGQMVFLAQYGFFVPAKEAKLGLSSNVRILIGDSQSVERGLSSFGSEMEELKEILDNYKDRAIVLIDEIASGTNPIEGKALTKAIVEYLKNKSLITLITTHFDLGEDEGIKNLQVIGLANMDVEILEREIRYAKRKDKINIISKYMDYRLIEVKEKIIVPKDALNIAKIFGIDKEIIEKAKKYI